MSAVLLNVLTIFSLVLIGYIACKKDVLPFAANDYFVKMLLSICIPCMIISSMSTKELDADTLDQVLQMTIGSALYFVLGAVISYFIVKLFRCRPKEDQGVLMVLLTSINSGFMGFPITKAIFGDECLFMMVLNNSVMTFYLYSILLMQLHVGEKQSHLSLKERFKPMCNACMYASIAGFIILFAQIRLPQTIINLTDLIGAATTPISMFVVGIQLSQSNFRAVIKNRTLLMMSLASVIVMPLLTLLAIHWLPLNSTVKASLVFAVAFPTAVISVALAAKEKKNAGLMAEGVALTTLFSMVTLPVWAMILLNLYF